MRLSQKQKKQNTESETRDAGRETFLAKPIAESVIPLRKNGQRNWETMSDDRLIQHARDFMKENGITRRKQLRKTNRRLYRIMLKRDLLEKISFENERRALLSMDNNQLIQYTQVFMKEKGITRIGQLQTTDSTVYEALRKRKLLGEVGFERKRRERRDWPSMTNVQMILYTQDFMCEKKISGKGQLQYADKALYEALRLRNLLSLVFSDIESARKQETENRQLVGLSQAALAMEKFGEGEEG